MRVLRGLVRLSLGLAALMFCTAASALDAPFVHDPSPVVKCDGRYYVFSTGRGIPILSSDDGYTWQREGQVFDKIPDSVHALVPKNNGTDVWAPQVIPMNGEYYLYYSISSWGQFVSAVGLATNPTLNQKDPRYKWTDRGMVVHSVEGENLNAIDPGVILTPDQRLWISYGSYHGNIELVQLNPKTGLRISPHSHVTIISSHSEASDIIYHGGYYYLLVNHGSCCQGPKSTYTIRMGRSKLVTGPYLDKNGVDMVKGGGSLFLGAANKMVGPGQFGLLDDDGVEKFSCHFEADLSRGGRPVLEIRPLLWPGHGWPEAGDNVADGTYQVRSQRTGTVLALTPDVTPEPPPRRGPNAPPVVAPAQAVVIVPPPTVASLQITDYLTHDAQEWAITSAGGGFYKLVALQGNLALTVDADAKLTAIAFTDADGQLWKIDQLTDGSYRIRAKTSGNVLTLTQTDQAQGVELKPYTAENSQSWEIVAP
jgi:arabinan endo-1,5-alpha-L-arabinosidase